MSMRLLSAVIIAAFGVCTAAVAGPPFLTDDPEPTAHRHWEIYGPLIEADGKGGRFQGATAVEINYGLAPDVQLTVGLPVAFRHDSAGLQSGAGDIDISLKYRFLDDQASGWQAAVFPGVSLPTARSDFGSGRVTALLPVWAQKDSGPWSIFGGGGYAINPGPGNRNYWTGGLAASRQITPDLRLGVEINRQGADSDDARAFTSLGLAAIYQLRVPFRILVSAGPQFDDNESDTGFHAFVALGLDY
jgi:hypothetical protein